MQRLGLRVIELRQAIDVTQEELAERVGLSRRQMNRVEAGTTNSKLSLLIELSAALKVDVGELFVAPSKSTVRSSGRPPKRSS
ncbi:MAG TPA: helix-turn-helix transcriptional regulator [Polyangiaceae bacterium]|jgi:transcriptional regulator with XRE-family HTH domain